MIPCPACRLAWTVATLAGLAAAGAVGLLVWLLAGERGVDRGVRGR